MAPLFVAVVQVLPDIGDVAVELLGQDEQGLFGQVVEDGLELIEVQRQVVLDAGRDLAVADRLVDQAQQRVAGDVFPVAFAESPDRVLVGRELARGQQLDAVGFLQRALVRGLKQRMVSISSSNRSMR